MCAELSPPRPASLAAVHAGPRDDGDQHRLCALIEQALREWRGSAAAPPAVRLASRLDADLGLDSLSRMELLLRIEQAFAAALPEDTLQRAERVADLLAALREARRGPGAGAAARIEAPHQRLPAADAQGDDEPLPAHLGTLTEVLDWHCARHPDRVQHRVLHDDGSDEAVTYAGLREQALRVAAALQEQGVAARQCVAIMLPTSTAYFAAWLGVLAAGAIPVPIYPPARAAQLEEHVRRHVGILANAQAAALITVPEARMVARLLRAQVPTLARVLTPADWAAIAAAQRPAAAHPDNVAFVQYTSGSTGAPKGVALTHANLLANIRAMAQAVDATPRDTFVSWLPLYHDMGLIGAWLGGMAVGYPLVVMSPLSFLARPLRWLEAIDRWRGTLSAAPNFAYELCLKRIGDDELARLDLSCWRLAFDGAEAVGPDTLQRFAARLARCGLREGAPMPVYGLAECSLGLLFPPPGRGPRVDAVEREALARMQRARPAATPDALRFVACGRPLAGHEVRLVDAAGRTIEADRIEGRLEFRGPSATRGYWRNPRATAQLIRDDWLDSGDRAYRAEGDYFITGRVKDIVIRGGRNLYPQAIEEAVGAVEGVRRGCVAAFGSADAARGTERLIVLAETRVEGSDARAALVAAVAAAVVRAIGEPADEIVLVPPHAVLKTSSGKLRRSACRDRWEAGLAAVPPPGARRQALRLAAATLWGQAQRGAAAAGRAVVALRDALAGVRIALAVALAALPLWLAVAAAPTPRCAWSRAARGLRATLRAAGLALTVRGAERLPAEPCVVVCNHAGYADGLLLVAALPLQGAAFVAKRELETQRLAGRVLARLGALFVERADAPRSVADARRMAEAVQQGRSLIVFPEGTFGATPDLRPFHLGAFLAAAQARVPLLPVALGGTRELMRGGLGWPRRAALSVTVGTAIAPPPEGGEPFAAAVRLRDAARCAVEAALAEDGAARAA